MSSGVAIAAKKKMWSEKTEEFEPVALFYVTIAGEHWDKQIQWCRETFGKEDVQVIHKYWKRQEGPRRYALAVGRLILNEKTYMVYRLRWGNGNN